MRQSASPSGGCTVVVGPAESLADEYWAYYRTTAHFWNIDRGDVEQVGQWEDLTPDGVHDRLARLADFGRRADELAATDLPEAARTLLGALSFSAGATAATLPFTRDLTLVAGSFNFAAFVSVLVPGYTLVSREHGEGYVEKLLALPEFVDGWVEGLRDGVAAGRVATARGIAATSAALDAVLALAPADHPLASQSPPLEASDAEVRSWRSQVDSAIRTAVQPAVTRLRDALEHEILPHGRADSEAGLVHIRGGPEAYRKLLWASTSTELGPEVIHQLGLEQLAMLEEEYRAFAPVVLTAGEPAAVRERLREDRSLRYTSADEIVADAMAALARAEAEAPKWFGSVPTARCTAVAIDVGPLAFYTGPSPDGRRGGTFFFRTGDPTAWTRYGLEVTTFHESVPGHHLQVAGSQALGLHPILSELEVTSYGEGWGLYAERLADEMSLYSSPLHQLGMLTLDSLRAARLVVDTGIHALGWPRERGVDFLLAHTAQDRAGATTEVDRYIADPGQATSYMVGRLEIERLREQARTGLGEEFSIASFHDVVLGNGMLPLSELRRCVERWIERSMNDARSS